MLTILFVYGFIFVQFPIYIRCISDGNKPATVGQFPSTGGFLRVSDNRFVGGATIIHPQYVMGVKFNLENTGYQLRVFAGDIDHYANSTTPTRQTRLVTHYFKQDFGRYPSLLIFRLRAPFRITKAVKVSPFYRKVLKHHTVIRFAGWGIPTDLLKDDGIYYTQYMNYAEGEVANHENCVYDWVDQGAWSEFFCIYGGTNPSMGKLDHGGPVYIDNRIVGIANPLLERWNWNNSRRVALMDNLQEWIDKVVVWDGKRKRDDAISVYDDSGRSLQYPGRSDAVSLSNLFDIYPLILFASVLEL